MKLIIEIDMDNAAFAEHPDGRLGEAMRILRGELAKPGTWECLLRKDWTHPLFDANGNRAGTITVQP